MHIHIVTSGLWLINENLNDIVAIIVIVALFLKGAYLFRRTSCSNTCLKSTMLNARKCLQPPHSLLEDHLEPSIISWRVMFCRSSCSHAFFQGLYRTDNFRQQLLIKKGYVFGRSILCIQFFKGSLLISPLLLPRFDP